MTDTTLTPRYERSNDVIYDGEIMLARITALSEERVDRMLAFAESAPALTRQNEIYKEAFEGIANDHSPNVRDFARLTLQRAALAAAVPMGGENGK